MKEQIKSLRIEIDGLAQLASNLRPKKEIMMAPMIMGNQNIQVIKFNFGFDEDQLEKMGYEARLMAAQVNVNSKEIEKAVDSLYLAKAWLGKMLSLLGEDTPYKNDGKRKSVEDIENTADVFIPREKEVSDYSQLFSHIQKVDWLRQEIKRIVDDTPDFSEFLDYIELEQSFVYKHLCEARFWMGWELSRVKNS